MKAFWREDNLKGQFIMLHKQGGWILIDSLVGMTILVTSLMLLAGMFYFATMSTASEKNYRTAVTLAQQAAETLQKYDGAPQSGNFPTLQQSTNGIFTIRPKILTTVTNIDAAHALYPVEINVIWTETLRQNTNNVTVNKSIKLTTYYYLNPNS